MKKYEEYLEIIGQNTEEEHRSHHDGKPCPHLGTGLCIWTQPRYTFDVSVEIMGMMMQDFLEDLKLIYEKHSEPTE